MSLKSQVRYHCATGPNKNKTQYVKIKPKNILYSKIAGYVSLIKYYVSAVKLFHKSHTYFREPYKLFNYFNLTIALTL